MKRENLNIIYTVIYKGLNLYHSNCKKSHGNFFKMYYSDNVPLRKIVLSEIKLKLCISISIKIC